MLWSCFVQYHPDRALYSGVRSALYLRPEMKAVIRHEIECNLNQASLYDLFSSALKFKQRWLDYLFS